MFCFDFGFFFVFNIETFLGPGAITRFIRQLAFKYLNITEKQFKIVSSVIWGLSSSEKYL